MSHHRGHHHALHLLVSTAQSMTGHPLDASTGIQSLTKPQRATHATGYRDNGLINDVFRNTWFITGNHTKTVRFISVLQSVQFQFNESLYETLAIEFYSRDGGY